MFRNVLIVSACLFALPAFAQSTSALITEVDAFGSRVTQLEETYLKPAVIASRFRVEARFSEASVSYFQKNYDAASLQYASLLRDPRFATSPSRRTALFNLGDSLFELRNYLAARDYFRQLMALGPGDYFGESAGRLMQIAYKIRDYSEVDRIYAQMQSAQIGPALSYLAGKAFYEKKDYVKARENFSRALADPDYSVLATYYTGVTFAAEKRFAEAKKSFESLAKASASNERDLEALELVQIALGRVAYEVGEFDFAIDHYGQVRRTSKHFDRALWEQTWAFVAQEEFGAARQNVDVMLLLEDPDPNLVAEAQLLRADLSLKLKQYKEATADYGEVIDKFTPISTEMNEFAVQQQDLASFFQALVNDAAPGLEPEFLPPLVAEWAASDRDMKRASQTLRDVRDVDNEVRELSRLLDETSARLNSGSRVMLFDELTEGLNQGIAAENRLVEVRRTLLAQRRAASTGVNEQEWEGYQRRLDALEKQFREIPSSRAAISQREEKVMSEFGRLRRQVDDLGYELGNMKAQLQAIRSYLDNKFGRALTDRERAEMISRQQELASAIREVEGAKKMLESEINVAQNQVGSGDAVTVAEARLRGAYRDELKRAAKFLQQYPGSGESSQIDGALTKITTEETRLISYFGKLNAFVDEEVDDYRRDVDAERDILAAHRRSIQILLGSTDSGAGVLAHLTFMRARAQFAEIVLKGDVGLIDVVWSKKEDMSTQIGQFYEDRESQLRALEDSFEEVR